MDRIEKQQIRDFIGQHLDLGKTRLSDDDALFLRDLIQNWPKYAGREISHENEDKGFDSDGWYRRVVKTTTTFLEDRVGVQIESSTFFDGAPHGTGSVVVTNARALVDLFRERPHLLDDRFAR